MDPSRNFRYICEIIFVISLCSILLFFDETSRRNPESSPGPKPLHGLSSQLVSIVAIVHWNEALYKARGQPP
jgi:hypothetical protein